MRKIIALSATVVAVSAICFGEAQRTSVSFENKFPELNKWEVGAIAQDRKFEDGKLLTLGAYGRYRLLDRVTVDGTLPVASSSKDFGEDGTTLGDINLGLQLLAYQDKAFLYPFVIPHFNVTLPTGDPDKGTGNEDTGYLVGMSIGTKTHDCLTWVGDVSYSAKGGVGAPDELDQAIIGLSIVWDLDDSFALIGEGKVAGFGADSPDGRPYYAGGGFAYKFTENLQFSLNGGMWNSTREDVDVVGKLSYSF